MANHSSAQKRNRQNTIRRDRNRAVRSKVRGAIKLARAAIESKADNKDALVKDAIREIYRASSKNVFASGMASRTVGRLMKAASAS